MLQDSSPVTDPLPSQDTSAPPADKVRIYFRKDGLLRLVSHHDLMHVFERMFRRAKIPFRTTQGFHPQPRIVFALSLALGIVGRAEIVEVELEQPVDPEEIQRRMAHHGPPGLEVLSVRRISLRDRAQVARVTYRVAVPADRQRDLPGRITDLLDSSHCWVERTRPTPRRLDLRPFLHDVHLAEDHLQMTFWVSGSAGTARPEEILQQLGLADVLEAGAILERSKLELRDELPETDAGPPSLAQEGPRPAGAAPSDRAPRPTSLVPGPLSFDS